MPACLRITLRQDQGDRVISGYAQAFNPSDGSIMLLVAPDSPAGKLIQLSSVKLIALEPTDGRPLPLPPSVKGASPGIRLGLSGGDELSGEFGIVARRVGVWLRPPKDNFGLVFVPQWAVASVELLSEPPEFDPSMWAFLNDSSPTDEFELPFDETPTTPTQLP